MANYNKLYQWVLRIANPQLVYAGLQIQRDKLGYYDKLNITCLY